MEETLSAVHNSQELLQLANASAEAGRLTMSNVFKCVLKSPLESFDFCPGIRK